MISAAKPSLLFFAKGKLLHVDCLLPFIAECRETNSFGKITVIIFDKNFSRLFEEAPVYRSAVQQFKVKIIYPNLIGSFWPAISLTYFFGRVLLSCLTLLLSPKGLVFGLKDIAGSKFYRWFFRYVLISRTIRPLSFFVSPYYGPLIDIQGESNGQPLNSTILLNKERVLITSFPDVELTHPSLNKDDIKVLMIGAIRSAPAWLTFLKSESRDLHFERRDNENIIFWPLSVLERTNDGLLLNFGDTMLEVLSFLAAQKADIKIIFKYHPTTDRKKFNHILKESGFKNYEFSQEHAGILISKSDFVFSTHGSTLFLDSQFFGKPNVLFLSKLLTKGKTNGYFKDDVFTVCSDYVIQDNLNELLRIISGKNKSLSEKDYPKFNLDPLIKYLKSTG